VSAANRMFNWMGVVLTLACFAIVLAGNTAIGWRFEHAGLPLSWVLAGGAVLAFLATEFCDLAGPPPSDAEDSTAELSSQWEAVELQS
jgi:hypothetical protein